MRGPLTPSGIPVSRSRAEQFDDLVLDAVDELGTRWGAELARVEFSVEDVPPSALLDIEADEPVPLAGLARATPSAPARIVLYRRPLESRAVDADDLADLVREVVIEEVAELLGLDPDTVDPE